ncbi:MAG TPA: carboxypeptidase regulatory-like domain-containing protein [Acidobacteriaceae bacterium]|nr:carboxypeptidase regulatory-like domain-containing protein [Acidobacteriaceae bacterium]
MHRKSFWPRFVLAAIISVAIPLSTAQVWAQAGAAGTGTIHGQVTDPAGAPVNNGTISLYPGNGGVSPETDAKYSFPIGADGAYKGENVAAGTYTLVYRASNTPKNQVVDQIDNIKVTAGQDTTANDDMSRPEYIAKLTPEQKKALEETIKKNSSILKENAQIKNLNADLTKAREDDKNHNFQEAAALMQKDANIKPDAAVLWIELGIAQEGLKQYGDAQTNLQKGIQLDQASKKPNNEMDATAYDRLGEAFANDGKVPEAQAAYDNAAKLNPAGAGTYYGNEAIMMDRISSTAPAAADAVVPAAEKAIAAAPNNPIPYYLKGKALVTKATVDQKTGKIVAPPGCQEAYQKYLELAPNGPFSADAKQILAEMSQTPSTNRASKKH